MTRGPLKQSALKRRTTMTRWAAAIALPVLLLSAAARADVSMTKHNLSITGPGPIRAVAEPRICKFCHTPHTAQPASPLWNRRDSGRLYVKYWSPTLDAYGPGAAPPVQGSSRLCLGCHDGTVALGDVAQGGPIRMRPGADRVAHRPDGPGFSGTDFSGSHPISFRVTQALIARNNAKGEELPLKPLAAMRSDPDVKLDKQGRIQCTTCHDPHKDASRERSGAPFWRKPTWEGVCLVCHEE